MATSVPLASQEVRWFFDGESAKHATMKTWFEQHSPYSKASGVGPPEWRQRKDAKPDIYLLMPGADDMGIKGREGELQVKGRVSDIGATLFGERHVGRVERWVKWSYAGLPGEYRRIFERTDPRALETVEVYKTRALRKIRMDTMSGTTQEVDASAFVDRGLNIEMTDLTVDDKQYCSIGFEAFPDDTAMYAAFCNAVGLFLQGLTPVVLSVNNSRSYPKWLHAR
jgi:hypothetical protein